MIQEKTRKFPGCFYSFDYKGVCITCGDKNAVIRVSRVEDELEAYGRPLCEACSLLIHHAWTKNYSMKSPLDSVEPHSVRVLIVFERQGDLTTPCEFLLVQTDEQDDVSYYDLPGGVLQSGETPAEGACRWLQSMTGLSSWPGALEQLHLSCDMRGRLVQTFLCRAYAGELPDDELTLCLPAPLAKHPSWNKSLHLGIDQAFLTRAKLQRSEAPENPLTVALSKAASLWIASKLASVSSQETLADRKLRDAYWMSLDTHEQNACRLVVALQTVLLEKATLDSPTQNFALAAALAAPQSVPQSSAALPAQPQSNVSQTSPVSAGAVPTWEADGDDSDLMFAEGRESGGFVPPRK